MVEKNSLFILILNGDFGAILMALEPGTRNVDILPLKSPLTSSVRPKENYI